MHVLSRYLSCIILLCACNNRPAGSADKPQPSKPTQDTAGSKIAHTETILPTDRFSIDKLEEYRDTLQAYWARYYRKKELGYKIKLDTLKEEGHMKYSYEFKARQSYPSKFTIYEFGNSAAATEHFNELKTRELVEPFGLTKSANHILVNGKYVYWHNYDHSYGHRMNDYKRMFTNVFDFHPKENNLDSVSGFTYCKCKHDDADLSGISGKWYSDKYIKAYEDNNRFRERRIMNDIEEPETITLFISKDSIEFNNMKSSYKDKSSKKLPDTEYYFKYAFFEDGLTSGTPEFLELMKKLQALKIPLTEYHMYTSNRLSITIIHLNNGKAFAMIGDRFYTLRRK